MKDAEKTDYVYIKQNFILYQEIEYWILTEILVYQWALFRFLIKNFPLSNFLN